MFQKLLGAVFGLAVLGTAGTAGAVPFSVSGVCAIDCANIGLSAGDPVGGTINILDASFTPSNGLTVADLESFFLTYGSVQISDATAATIEFTGTVDATGTGLATYGLFATEVIGSPGDYLIVSSDGWVASLGGYCTDAACTNSTITLVDGFSQGGGTITLAAPEPSTLALFATGLAGLGFFGWRRRRQRVA